MTTLPYLHVTALSLSLSSRLGDFKPQSLANLAWAFAASGHGATALFEAICDESAARLPCFEAQERLAPIVCSVVVSPLATPNCFPMRCTGEKQTEKEN